MINKPHLKRFSILGGVFFFLNVLSAFAEVDGPLPPPEGYDIPSQPSSWVQLVFLVSCCVFTYGLIRYSWGYHKNNDVLQRHGKKFMFWSMLMLLVLIAIYVIIGYAQSSVGLRP
jgi:hypothetical protein